MTKPDSLLDATLADPGRRHALLLRYLRNQLLDAQVEALEVRLLEDPALLAEIEEEQLLLDGMKDWTGNELNLTSASLPASKHRPLWQRSAIAATAALLALIPVAWWLEAQHPRLGAEAALYTLTTQRGPEEQDRPSLVEVPKNVNHIVLRLPATNQPGVRNLELWRQGEAKPKVRLQVEPDADGWVVAVFERSTLPDGNYQFRWMGAADGVTTNFELKGK